MKVDLVQVTTRDGVRLDGALREGDTARPRQLTVDCCLLIHGTGGSFYSSSLFDAFSDRMTELACAVLRVNTRGHDLISTAVTTQGGRRLGAAYELVDDCCHDLAAWIEWLTKSGYSRIALVGHSLGAVKSVYALAKEPQLSVVALVALSPPRLSYSHFIASEKAAEFSATFQIADEHVRSGRSATLMEVQVPLPFVVTAGGYVEKYGPDERYNFLKYVESIRIPALVTFGSVELETNLAFRGLPQLLAPILKSRPSMHLEVIQGADHFYSSRRVELVACTEKWLISIDRLGAQ